MRTIATNLAWVLVAAGCAFTLLLIGFWIGMALESVYKKLRRK